MKAGLVYHLASLRATNIGTCIISTQLKFTETIWARNHLSCTQLSCATAHHMLCTSLALHFINYDTVAISPHTAYMHASWWFLQLPVSTSHQKKRVCYVYYLPHQYMHLIILCRAENYSSPKTKHDDYTIVRNSTIQLHITRKLVLISKKFNSALDKNPHDWNRTWTNFTDTPHKIHYSLQ